MLVRTGVDVGVNLLLSILLVRQLGQTALGSYIYASSLAALVYSILGFGISTIITREIARDPSSVGALVFNGLAIRLAITLPLALATSLGLSLILPMTESVRQVVWIVSLLVGVGFATELVFGVFQAVGKFEYHLTLSVCHKLGMLALASGAIYAGFGLLPVVWLFAAMQGLTLGLSVLLLVSRIAAFDYRIDLALWRSLIRRSLPLAFSGFSETVNNRSDSVLLGSLRSAQEVGIYGAAYAVYLGVAQLLYSLVVGGFPSLSKTSVQSSGATVKLFINLSLIMLGVTSVAALTGLLLSTRIVQLVYGTDMHEASKCLNVLVVALIFFGLERLCLATLTSVGLQNCVLWSTLIGAAVNVSLNLAFIPRYGYMGASYSTLLTEIVVLGAGALFLFNRYRDEQRDQTALASPYSA
jgi:O-antigen/teichoic acid export membrane protein